MNNKLITVTGGAGFIGKEVVKILIRKGYKVRVADEFINHRPEDLPKGTEILKGDIGDQKIAYRALRGASYCIHLASKIGGPKYIEDNPATILFENNNINSAVFNACTKNKVKKIVYVSSGMVYPSTNKQKIAEKDIGNTKITNNFYATSKIIGEAYCKAYYKEYGLSYSIARLFNVYGNYYKTRRSPGLNHVIQELTCRVLSGNYPLEIYGSGNQIRSFTHVTDAAEGIVKCLLGKNSNNQDFNISSEEQIKIIDLAKQIWKYSGRKEPFKVRHLKPFLVDSKNRVASAAKAKKLLGWSANMAITDGLKNYVEWLKGNYSKIC